MEKLNEVLGYFSLALLSYFISKGMAKHTNYMGTSLVENYSNIHHYNLEKIKYWENTQKEFKNLKSKLGIATIRGD